MVEEIKRAAAAADPTAPPAPVELDAVSALALVAYALTEQATQLVEAAGFPDLRPAHGRLFGRLQHGPRTVTELATDLEVTPQAVSKTLRPLADAGYLTVDRTPADGRARVVTLADRGHRAVAAARAARTAVVADLETPLADALPVLLDVIAELGIETDRRTFRA